jgi:hypothetical protein
VRCKALTDYRLAHVEPSKRTRSVRRRGVNTGIEGKGAGGGGGGARLKFSQSERQPLHVQRQILGTGGER